MSSSSVIVRLQMLGAAAFASASAAAAAGVSRIGSAASGSNAGVSRFTATVNKMSGPLSAVGSASTAMAQGLALAGTAAVGLGLKFNASMEQSTVAFTNLLGGADEAKDMLDELYEIAAHTPFEFPQLTQSTQRLLGFGMVAKDVIPTMTAVGDAVAAAGGGAEQIDRVSTALGQMQAKGKVSSEELNQMAESGIPALKILQDELGLTGMQLSKKLQAGAVTADKGISALVAGMSKKYDGMAAAQSKTFNGMISTLKDSATQVLGKVTMPLFEYIRDNLLPSVAKVTDGISKWANAGGVQKTINALKAGFSGKGASETAGYTGAMGTMVKIGRVLGNVFRQVKGFVMQFMDALKPMAPFLTNIIFPILKGIGAALLGSVVGAFRILIPVIKLVATVLGWIGQKAAPLKPVFFAIGYIIGTVFGPAILKAISTLGKFGGIFKVVAAGAKVAYVAVNSVTKMFGIFTGKIGRWGPTIARTVASIWPQVKATASKLLDGFKRLGGQLVDKLVEGIKGAPSDILNALFEIIPGGGLAKRAMKKVLGLATGGHITSPGVAMVGERGPELVHLDRGASVIPLNSPSVANINLGGGMVTVPVYLDGRVITTVVADRTADRMARR